jgi:hypothetical protein
MFADGSKSKNTSICIPSGFVQEAGEVLQINSAIPQA